MTCVHTQYANTAANAMSMNRPLKYIIIILFHAQISVCRRRWISLREANAVCGDISVELNRFWCRNTEYPGLWVQFALSPTGEKIKKIFFLLASQNMQLIGYRISDGSFYFSFCYWLIVLGIVLSPIMWLGSPKNMKSVNIHQSNWTFNSNFHFKLRFGRLICSISVVTVLVVSCLIWTCILQDESMTTQGSFQGIMLDEPNYLKLVQVYGIITFQFDIHPMLMTIEVDMTQKHKIGKVVCFGLLGKNANQSMNW